MNKHGNYTLHLFNMENYMVPYKGSKYVFCSVISQRLKPLNVVLYRRWFQLCQFTLSTPEVYGVPALNCDKYLQTLSGHTTSLHVVFHTEDGSDYISED